jgi:hypothetical protein
MKLDELREAWKSQDTRTTVRTVLLLESIRKKQRRYDTFIWLRNIREGWLTILAAVYFACSAESDVVSKARLWPFYLAMAILFGIGVFRVLDNRRQKRRAIAYEESALSFIECSLLHINHRIWLLENIFWWCVLPLAVGGILVISQIVMVVDLHEPTVLFWKLGPGAAIGCMLLGFLYWGNRWTARKYWLPRKTELEAIVLALKTT